METRSLPPVSDGVRSRATVKWFDNAKGFGFLIDEDPEFDADIFVHFRSILGDGYKTLKEGQVVDYTRMRNGHRFNAAAVQRVYY